MSPETATLPAGWEDRLVKLTNENTDGAIGWCLEPHDLAYSKLTAHREKDITFVTELVRHKMIRPSVMERLVLETEDEGLRETLEDFWAVCRRRVAGVDSKNPSDG